MNLLFDFDEKRKRIIHWYSDSDFIFFGSPRQRKCAKEFKGSLVEQEWRNHIKEKNASQPKNSDSASVANRLNRLKHSVNEIIRIKWNKISDPMIVYVLAAPRYTDKHAQLSAHTSLYRDRDQMK